MAKTSSSLCVSRRAVLEASAATAAALAASSVFAPAVHAARGFKIGYVSPRPAAGGIWRGRQFRCFQFPRRDEGWCQGRRRHSAG